MERVLHVTEMLQAAGIESFIMNSYRAIDREKIQYDFLITRNQNEFYDNEVAQLGGIKYTVDYSYINSTLIRVLKESLYLYKFLKKSQYKVVHIHSGTPLRVFYLIAAKKAGVKTRIYHSHSAKVRGPHKLLKLKFIIFNVLKQFIPVFATHLFACSQAAGEWMFPSTKQDRVVIIKNGIDTEKYKINLKVRDLYRKEMEIEDKYVIGHIGRFNEQKNHSFLINVFNEFLKKEPNSILMLLGEGELLDQINAQVQKLGIEKNVLFLGVRKDINNLLQAMDVFVLPSNYEGLPVVGIEAQASGNLCLLSSNVTPEIQITNNVKLLPIDSVDVWVNELEKAKEFKKYDTSNLIINQGYDIKTTAKLLETIYLGEGNM